MKATYICPQCHGVLNIKDDIILSAQNSKNEVGLILMHPEPGNYSIRKTESFELEIGESIIFYCPICHARLDARGKDNLASLLLLTQEKKESMVFFSKTFGEKATYHIQDKQVLSYGEHCKKYTDPEWFL